MRDAVQTRSLFIIRMDDILGGRRRIGRLEHGIPGPGVVVPAMVRFQDNYGSEKNSW